MKEKTPAGFAGSSGLLHNPNRRLRPGRRYLQRRQNVGAGRNRAPLEKVSCRQWLSAGQPPDAATHPGRVLCLGTDNLLNPDDESLSTDLMARNILDRAAMVGGAKFARELATLFEQADAMALANQPPALTVGQRDRRQPRARVPSKWRFSIRLISSSCGIPKTNFLWIRHRTTATTSSLPPTITPPFTRQQRMLLWRTRMTVNSRGGFAGPNVANAHSPPRRPISDATCWSSEVIVKRAREGEVTIGTPTVIEMPPRSRPRRRSEEGQRAHLTFLHDDDWAE